MSTITPDGDDGDELALDDTSQFALTGNKRRLAGFYCREVVTRLGGRGWVTEDDLKAYSNA